MLDHQKEPAGHQPILRHVYGSTDEPLRQTQDQVWPPSNWGSGGELSLVWEPTANCLFSTKFSSALCSVNLEDSWGSKGYLKEIIKVLLNKKNNKFNFAFLT